VLLLALAAAGPTSGCARGNEEGDQANAAAPAAGPVTGMLDRSQAGRPAPAITFEDPAGRPTSMAAFQGKPVLVNLWATWCAPCIVEMPSLDALAAREGDALHVLALSQDLDGRAAVTNFFAQRGLRELEAYLDPQMAFMTALNLGTLPTTILYDAQGKEVWRMVGAADWKSERVAGLLLEAEGG